MRCYSVGVIPPKFSELAKVRVTAAMPSCAGDEGFVADSKWDGSRWIYAVIAKDEEGVFENWYPEEYLEAWN